jgi:hypothetical protein
MDEDIQQNPDDDKNKTPSEEAKLPDDKENTETENSLAEINMEVHHHPQLEHKAKPWKEYILEGLMIFFAVMMGFFAENIREGITNRQHVKELVSQLNQDIRSDTSQLNTVFREETEIFESDSELIDLLQHSLKEVNMDQLQQLIVQSHSLWPFHPSTGAMAAIKNEIHLSQFSNSNMIGLIAAYEKHIELLHTVQDINLQYQRMYIDPFLVHHFTSASLHASFNGKAVANVEARNLTQEDLIQLGSEMSLISINTKELLDNNRRLFNDASHLLNYTKKQFNPDE